MTGTVMLQLALPLAVFLCLFPTGCGKRQDVGTRSQSVRREVSGTDRPLMKRTTTIESSLSSEKLSGWKTNTVNLPGREGLRLAYFLDAMHGWVASERALYRTANGGGTWEGLRIELPNEAQVVDVFFLSPSVGYIAAQKYAPGVMNYRENQIWLLKTTNGGQSWHSQYEQKESVVTRVSFVNTQEGWLTGVKYLGLEPVRFGLLILHTLDQGEHWTDVSEPLNRIAANENGLVNELITDLNLETTLTTTVLTNSGRVFSTNDGAQSWRQIGFVGSEPKQTRIYRLGIGENKHLWVAGGADSIKGKGIWGMLAVERDDSWSKYRLTGASFLDVAFLSDKEVLACGSMPHDAGNPGEIDRRNGVILYSADEGNNWTIIYRNKDIKSVNSLAVLNPHDVCGVGDNGLIVRLTTVQNN